MSGKAPAFQFYPADWMQDTRPLSLAAKGAWIDLLCAMWRSQTKGTLLLSMVGYSRLIGATVDQTEAVIKELTDLHICDSEPDASGRVRLMSRRMSRDAIICEQWRLQKQNQRVRKVSSDCPAVSSSSPSSSTPLSEKFEDGKYPDEWVKQAEAAASKANAGDIGAYMAKVLDSWSRMGGPPRNAKPLGGGPAIPGPKKRNLDDFCENCEAFIGAGSREITVSVTTGEKKMPVCRHCGAALAIRESA